MFTARIIEKQILEHAPGRQELHRTHLKAKTIAAVLLTVGSTPLWAESTCIDASQCSSPAQNGLVINDSSTYFTNIGSVRDITLNGGSLIAFRDATVINTTLNSGYMDVSDNAIANGTLLNDGWMVVACNTVGIPCSATANDTVVNGGTLDIFHTSTVNRTTLNNGSMKVWQTATANDTTLDGGDMLVIDSATANNTTLNQGQLTITDNAIANDSTVNGGHMSVLGNASVNGTLVNGGQMDVFEHATARNSVVNDGGLMQVYGNATVTSTTVNAGGVMAFDSNAKALDTTINTGGALKLWGDATLSGTTHVDGRVIFATPAVPGDFHTLKVTGPLSGNGTYLMNTDIANLRSDRLHVQGEISGNNTLVVSDSGVSPAVGGQQLMLVDGNGGAGKFTLYGGKVDLGALRYGLEQRGDDWYLAGQDGPKPYGPDEEGTKPYVPGEISNLPTPEPENLSKGANATVASHAASAALISAQMNALVKRLGELRMGKDEGGLWTRGFGKEQRIDTGASRAFKLQINGFEIGADKALPFANGKLYLGGMVGKGEARQDFGEGSKGTLSSTMLGGYATYVDRSGLYVDSVLKYTHLDNKVDITSNLGEKVDANYKNHAVSVDVEIGKHIDLGKGWFVEPQVELQAFRINGGDYTASNGLNVEQDAVTSVQSRVGSVLGRNLKLDNGMTLQPYAKASWITEHAGDSHVQVNDTRLSSKLPGSRAEIGGGVILQVAEKHTFSIDAEYSKGSDIEEPWAVNVGYRYLW